MRTSWPFSPDSICKRSQPKLFAIVSFTCEKPHISHHTHPHAHQQNRHTPKKQTHCIIAKFIHTNSFFLCPFFLLLLLVNFITTFFFFICSPGCLFFCLYPSHICLFFAFAFLFFLLGPEILKHRIDHKIAHSSKCSAEVFRSRKKSICCVAVSHHLVMVCLLT